MTAPSRGAPSGTRRPDRLALGLIAHLPPWPYPPISSETALGGDETVMVREDHTPALETVSTWADKNGCAGELEPTAVRLDLDQGLEADETRVARFADCPGSSAEVELWTIEGGSHVPGLVQPGWPEAIVDFLLAHPKQ